MAEEPEKKAKRKVKNPETFRERAIRATEDADKPTRAKQIRKTGAVGAVFKPVGKALSAFFGSAPFKPVRAVLRLIGKAIFIGYFRSSWQELRLVTWPSWRESRRLTFAVLIFAIVFGAAVAGVDYGLDKAFRHILLK